MANADTVAIVSAVATAVAASVAVLYPVVTSWAGRRNRPNVHIDRERIHDFSENAGNGRYSIRLPIANKPGRKAAKDVEVYLEELTKEGAEANTPGKFVPMRLKWCHGDSPTCPSIPESSYRLLDLAEVNIERVRKGIPRSWEICGEVRPLSSPYQDSGVYTLKLSISADDMPTRNEIVRISILNNPEPNDPVAKVEVITA